MSLSNSYLEHSNAWDFLPSEVKTILLDKGFKKSYFRASVTTTPEGKRSATLRCTQIPDDAWAFLTHFNIRDISEYGVGVVFLNGVLSLHLDIEDYYQIYELRA